MVLGTLAILLAALAWPVVTIRYTRFNLPMAVSTLVVATLALWALPPGPNGYVAGLIVFGVPGYFWLLNYWYDDLPTLGGKL